MPLSLTEDGGLVLAMTNPLDVISIDEVGMRTKRRVVTVMCTQSGFDDAVGDLLQLARQAQGGTRRRAGRENGDGAPAPPTSTRRSSRSSTACSPTPPAWPRRTSTWSRARTRSSCAAAWTACCTSCASSPRSCRPASSAASRSWATSTSPTGGCRRTGAPRSSCPRGQAVDLRLASIPSLYGENITIRILEVSALPPTLASLGLTGDNLSRFEAALKTPEGGIVIVGPTGSGKSTTLYTTLELIKSPERKVYTVEDPIERKITGIIQTEVKPMIGLTFAQALRSLVRADPDVIMVGEIRDLETAKMAADSAVTGHQVFSTLHTNDAASAVNRLVEMGVPRYLVAAAWHCFVAQRLVRRLCPHCRKPETMTDARWEELGLGEAPQEAHHASTTPSAAPSASAPATAAASASTRCSSIDDDMRDLIATGGSVHEIQRMARGTRRRLAARRRRRARSSTAPPATSSCCASRSSLALDSCSMQDAG